MTKKEISKIEEMRNRWRRYKWRRHVLRDKKKRAKERQRRERETGVASDVVLSVHNTKHDTYN